MSYTGLKYDDSAYDQLLRESIGTLKYQMNTPQMSQCFIEDPNIMMQKGGVSVDRTKQMIDIDSELMGITRKLSHDPKTKYIPKMDKEGNICSETKKINYDPCNNITTEPTRLSNPSYNLRGTGWNRWEWLCQNPQDKLDIEFPTNINTNILSRDSHRPLVPIPGSSINSLPKESLNEKGKDVYSFDEVPTGPVSVDFKKEPIPERVSYNEWQPNNILDEEAQVPTGPPSVSWQNANTIDNY